MRRVVLADDDRMLLGVIARFFQPPAWQTVLAGSAEQALQEIGDLPLSLAITDLDLPGMNGVELIGRLRRTRPDLPAILMSGFLDPRRLPLWPGRLLLLSKPFSLRALAAQAEAIAQPCS
jgi:DNA-binding response OmpR family regulator